MNVKWTNRAKKRQRLVIISLFGLANFLQASATPIPQNAFPIESKITAALGTSEFVVYSDIKYTNGCRLFSLVGCYSDFWEVCIRFNNAAAFKKAKKNDYKGPNSDFDYAVEKGSTMVFRDDKWYLDLGFGCRLSVK
jgi:hypothetical protein